MNPPVRRHHRDEGAAAPAPARRQQALEIGPEGRPRFAGGGYLGAVRLDHPRGAREFPFNIPALRKTKRLEFHPAITFFIGENGSGKSTLLEAIAVKARFSAEGGWKRGVTDDLARGSELSKHLTLERLGYPTDGWFLRAESFYNVASEVDERGIDYGYGGKSLHKQSHGEAFLSLLTNRLQGGGLYLFDEPEAALSPQRQLAVLALLHRLVYHRSQLVIATHSPILLAYPHARIFELGEIGIKETTYAETEQFRVTRDFLAAPQRMLELLLGEEEADLIARER